MRASRVLPILAFTLACSSALAHKPSDAYLTIERSGDQITGRLDVALRDLDTAIGLDGNGDGELTWGEVRAHHARIEAYALSRLTVRSGGEPCPLAVRRHLVDEHTDGHYAVLELEGTCPAAGPTLRIGYRLLYDIDPQHRGLLHYVEREASRSLVLSDDRPEALVGGDAGAWMERLGTYVHEGVFHIWLGFDHLLFLMSLLLPAVLLRERGQWLPAPSFRDGFVQVAKVVTAFTVAHSITLSLAVLAVVQLPSRWVESAIALSVVLAALNNVRPVVSDARWVAAFAFGLVHGFGFAGALQDLGLPAGALALSLFGFNLGVELGQLALVAAFLPLAFSMRASSAYRRGVLGAGSAAIAAIAMAWFVERAFDVPVFAAVAAVR